MPVEHPITERKSKLRAEAFRDAEASLLLEGLDPTTDPTYRELKAQFIAGNHNPLKRRKPSSTPSMRCSTPQPQRLFGLLSPRDEPLEWIHIATLARQFCAI